MAWIPHMPDFCPICGSGAPLPDSHDDNGIPSADHHCYLCGTTFRALVRVDMAHARPGESPDKE